MPTDTQQKIDGLVSVTEVLDFFIPKQLLDWYLKTGKAEAKRIGTVAMKIGSRVDELICQEINTGSYKLKASDGQEVKNCLEAWKQFKQDYQPKVKHTQLTLADNIDKVIGHCDLLTDTTLIDIKCSSSIRDNYWVQVAKYYSMLPVEENTTVYQVAILRLDKNLGVYEYKTHRDAKVNLTQCQSVFDGLLDAYRYYNPQRGTEE